MIAFSENPVILVFALVLGLVCGSFVTALSHRLPRGEDFVAGRSKCPRCEAPLRARDLFPVLSWLLSKGRCRHCGSQVSFRYPAIELCCGLLFVSLVASMDPLNSMRLAVYLPLTVALLALAVIDLEVRRLPNGLVLFVFFLCSVLAWLDQRSVVEVAAALFVVLVAGLCLRFFGQVFSNKPGLGWGDIKLALAISIAVTPQELPIFLIVCSAVALVLAAWFGWKRREAHIPLGPALCAGTFAVFL